MLHCDDVVLNFLVLLNKVY